MKKKEIEDIIKKLADGDIIEVSCCCQSQKTINAGNGYVPSGC